jgi:hypothetical protein
VFKLISVIGYRIWINADSLFKIVKVVVKFLFFKTLLFFTCCVQTTACGHCAADGAGSPEDEQDLQHAGRRI